MQLYAWDGDQRIIAAEHAVKQRDYTCIECQSKVRLRKGRHRRPHFYHLDPKRTCHLSGKSLLHLQVQCYLQGRLPEGDSALEHPFRQVGRIADVVWFSQRIVFEVQCSAIAAAEVEWRNRDYKKMGYDVVWILHDRRYNRWRVTAAEMFLRDSPTYFTNLCLNGKGCIYDQYAWIDHGIRKKKASRCRVDLSKPHPLSPSLVLAGISQLARRRLDNWPFHFAGDLLDHALRGSSLSQEVVELEKMQRRREVYSTFKTWVYCLIARPYILLFQLFLEKICR